MCVTKCPAIWMPAKFGRGQNQKSHFRTRIVQNTPLLCVIFILDHMFIYNICSAWQYLQFKLSHEYLAQNWVFMYKALATLTFVVTLTFDLRSWNIVYMLPRYEMHLSTKYEVNPFIGLGGVRGQTHTQTHTHTDRGPKRNI